MLIRMREPEKIWVKCAACGTVSCITEARCVTCGMPLDIEQDEIVDVDELFVDDVVEEVEPEPEYGTKEYWDSLGYLSNNSREKESRVVGLGVTPDVAQNMRRLFHGFSVEDRLSYLFDEYVGGWWGLVKWFGIGVMLGSLVVGLWNGNLLGIFVFVVDSYEGWLEGVGFGDVNAVIGQIVPILVVMIVFGMVMSMMKRLDL